MPKLVVMLRVKNGAPFVHQWLACYEKLADEIVVLDNGSTDGTDVVLKNHPKVVDLISTQGYNEGRDKNLLYNRVRLRQPEWCLWVDIDEIFEPAVTRKHLDRLMSSRLATRFSFRRFHFIDLHHFAASWFRLNYTAGPDRLLWKEHPAGYFEDKILDSPNVKGISGLKLPTTYRIMHLGYVSKDLVEQKAALYNGLIAPEKAYNIQGMYMHNERKLRWHNNRFDPRVMGINALLTTLMMRQWIIKAWRLVRAGAAENVASDMQQDAHTKTKAA